MKCIVEFVERHDETVHALVQWLESKGMPVDRREGVQRTDGGTAFITVEIDDDANYDAVLSHPDVTAVVDEMLANAPDPLSGCEEEYHETRGPLEGCEEPGDPDD